jgi:hypothetical protein
MNYALKRKKPQPAPTGFPEAIREDKKFLDSLLEDANGDPRNLAVINLHEDRYHGWIAPGDYGLVTRTTWASSFGWLKLVDVVADEEHDGEAATTSKARPKKKGDA